MDFAFDSGLARGALALGIFVGGLLLVQLSVSFLLRGVASFARRIDVGWDDHLTVNITAPLRVLLTVFVAWPLLHALDLGTTAEQVIERVLALAQVAGFGWLLLRLVSFGGRLVERRAQKSFEGTRGAEGRLRGVQTQVLVFRRIASIIVGVITIALALVQFEAVRTVGVSLLASAGVVGLVFGLAAQKPVAAILSGIQLAVTGPVRIGDTVVVEGESGVVEEINLTHLVVKIWDQRRLVVPMTRFLDQPFQNWTKGSTELLGTVFVQADHRVPMEALRAELDRVLDGHPKWDGRKKNVVVTNTSERSIELRALVSAKDSDDLWDLRCEVREQLVRWLATYEGGRYLPAGSLTVSPSVPA